MRKYIAGYAAVLALFVCALLIAPAPPAHVPLDHRATLTVPGASTSTPEPFVPIPIEMTFMPMVGMAAINTAAVSGWLKRQYASKNYFKPFQNDFTPTLNDLDECPDESPDGSGWFFPLFMSSAQNWRAGAEGSAMADVLAASEVPGSVTAQEFKGTVQLTEFLKRAGSAKGHFNGGNLAHQMKMITTDITKAMQRFAVLGHGTGRLGVVDDAVVTANTVKLRLNESWHGLAEQMRLDIVDLDTGGAVQVTNRTVSSIDKVSKGITGAGAINTYAGIATLSGAPFSATAGWGLYRSGDYGGNIFNGIRGIVQDGNLSASYFGNTYAANPKLKAQVLANNGSPRDISEDLMRQMADLIYHAGDEIDSIRCNTGVMNAIGALQTGDKRYAVGKGEGPKFRLGWGEGDLLFSYDKQTAVIKKDPQIPAREMFFLALKDTFYKHTLAELGWLDKGGSEGVLHLTPASGGGFDYSWTALLYAACNVSCVRPTGNGVIRDVADVGLAGD